MCRMYRNSWSFKLLETLSFVQACNGIVLPFHNTLTKFQSGRDKTINGTYMPTDAMNEKEQHRGMPYQSLFTSK